MIAAVLPRMIVDAVWLSICGVASRLNSAKHGRCSCLGWQCRIMKTKNSRIADMDWSQKRCVVLDMDGTVYLGHIPIAGAVRFIRQHFRSIAGTLKFINV